MAGVVKELASLKSIGSLELSFTKVTDAGAKKLAAFKHLYWLDLTQTKVTDAGIKELREALPKTTVVK
jgi:internalin A